MENFADLGVAASIATTLSKLGYERPTPIQEGSIPPLLEGHDLLAQAQTGTGKTAAFALPVLTQLDPIQQPQALVLAPTRELAIQVAEAFHSYAKSIKGFHVLPIYGGQDFGGQLRGLKRGAHVIVGTPGRIMDHLRRGTLVLDHIKTVILDEADEMLRMGFVDDVQWILEQIPTKHQTALFSATLPKSIRQIAKQYLTDPKQIQIKPTGAALVAIQQYFTIVSREHKLEAVTRFLEVEDFTAAIIFTRTKNSTVELAERLEARGYIVAAINGDMTQALREKVIKRLREGKLDILVATDVAARGLDVERISYVINYDAPYDVEPYIHRIGRTGRAGREGKSLILVTPRERRILKDIQRVTQQTIKEIKPPSVGQIKEKRFKTLIAKITQALQQEDLSYYRDFATKLIDTGKYELLDIAAATLFLSQNESETEFTEVDFKHIPSRAKPSKEPRSKFSKGRKTGKAEAGMTPCRIGAGRKHNLKPSDIVGVIANKCHVSRKAIGRISIFDQYTLVDIDSKVVDDVLRTIAKLKRKQWREFVKA